VGALTNKDFRFRCRVWFLSSTDSICPGCASGCNVEIHFRGDVIYRLKPRRNDAVNQTWMCDFGRLEYKKANEARLPAPLLRAGGTVRTSSWEAVLAETAFRLKGAVEAHGPEAAAVVASPRSSNEELWLVRRFAREVLGTQALAFTARTPGDGYADNFLIKGDKNPNSEGARLLGIPETFEDLVRRIAAGRVRALLVFGNALGDLADEEVTPLLSNVPFVAVAAPNDGVLPRAAHAVLPSASFAERGGTWTNFARRVQRFRAAFPPRGKARRDLEIVTGLANRLGAGWSYADEEAVFREMAAREPAFAGLSYASLGGQGAPAAGDFPAGGPR